MSSVTRQSRLRPLLWTRYLTVMEMMMKRYVCRLAVAHLKCSVLSHGLVGAGRESRGEEVMS